jgi:hypothetical protein
MMKEKLESKRIWIFMTVTFGIEAIATTFLIKGQPNPLFGPAVVSLLTFFPFTVLAFWLRAGTRTCSHMLTEHSANPKPFPHEVKL